MGLLKSTFSKINTKLFVVSLLLFSFSLLGVYPVNAGDRISANREYFPASKFGKINLRSKHFIRKFIRGEPFSPLSALNPEGKLRKLSRPIGRLDVLYKKNMSTCTAFLFHQSYIMTNHHCIDGKPKKIVFRLGYSFEGTPKKSRSFDVNIKPVEMNEKLDYAILRVDTSNPGNWSGSLKLSFRNIQDRQSLHLIGHPGGLPKMLSGPGNCHITNPFLHEIHRTGGSKVMAVNYNCSSIGGNSGSPVLDQKTGEVIALNHSSNKISSSGTPILEIAKVSPLVRDILRAREAAARGCFVFNQDEICGGTLDVGDDKVNEGGVLATILIAVPFKTQTCNVPVNVNCGPWKYDNREYKIKILQDGRYKIIYRNYDVYVIQRNRSFAKKQKGNLILSASLKVKNSEFYLKHIVVSPGDFTEKEVTTVKFKIKNNACRLINTSFVSSYKPKIPNWHKHFKVRKVKPRYCKILKGVQ